MKRRRTISSSFDETMDESTSEQSPATVSTRKRKRLDPVSFFFSFYNWVQLIFVGIARHRLITAILTPIFDLCAIRPAGNVSTIV